MFKLDLKDRKLLYEVDLDSRQSYNQLAKKLGISKDSAIYRLKRLQDEGIISRFHTLIDTGKLGLTSYRLYLKLQNTTPEKEQEIIDFLKSQRIVTWIVSIEDEYDLGMWILTKSVEEINQLWKALIQNYSNLIEKKALTIFTKVIYYTRGYLLEKEKSAEGYPFIMAPNEAELSKTDIEILKLLAPNSRISVVEIANKLGVTAKTVTNRIKLLEKNKVIVGYRTLFDIEKLGYQYFKVHFNLHNLTEEKYKQFRAYLKQHKNVIYDNEVLGGDDIELDVQLKSEEDLRAFINEIKEKYSDIIKNYKHMLFYKEHKFLFFPL